MVHKSILFLGLIFLVSCSTTRKITDDGQQQVLIEKVRLDEVEQRKFDYFFYEASREKMKGNLQKSALYLTECLKIDPTSSVSMYELANLLITGNEIVKAQGLLERAIQIEPDNIWYNLLLAELYQQNKLGLKAIAIYENIVKSNALNEEYKYGLAQLYQANGQFDNAIDTYEQLEKVLGLNEVIILQKEQIYLEQKKNKLAFNELQRLIDSNPDESRYYGYLADYYQYIKDYENAKLIYKDVLEKDPGNSMACFSLGNIARIEKDTSTFINYYKIALSQKTTSFEVKFQHILPLLMHGSSEISELSYLGDFFEILIKTHPYEPNSFIYSGNYYKAINKPEKALKSYELALSIQENNELVWQEYILLLIDSQNSELLSDECTKAVKLFPENSFFYLIGASAQLQNEKNESALQLLEEGYKYVGDNDVLKAQFLAAMGDVYYALKQTGKAFAVYDESLKVDELNIVVLNNYSYYLTLENRDLDKAERMSSKCIELEPGNSTYLDTYAWVLFKRGRFFEAKYIIERALDNGGNKSEVIVEHYGDILFKNGDVDLAVQQWILSESMGNKSEVLKEKIKSKSYIEE